jgi:hypothetical protein
MSRENTSTTSSISLQEFLKIPTEDMEIEVGKFSNNIFVKTTYEVVLYISSEVANLFVECSVQKRYTEFQGLYDSLTYRYQNLTFPSFPSKFQLVNVKESRKKFFDSLLKTVLKLAAGHPEIKKELLKILYDFVMEKNGGIEIKALTERKLNNSSGDGMNLSTPIMRPHSNSITDRGEVGSNISSLLNKNSDDISINLGPGLNKNVVADKRISCMPYMNDTAMIANMFQNEEMSKAAHTGIYYQI